jgi:hypothetical protein
VCEVIARSSPRVATQACAPPLPAIAQKETHQLCDSGVRCALQKTLLQCGQSPAILSAADGHCVGLAVMVGFASASADPSVGDVDGML